MSPLPSLIERTDAVAARLRQGPALIALDFDGTLTEIVDDPDRPRLTPERRGVLERVRAPGRHLAIVSGRALADVRARVPVDSAVFVGNHGLEVAGPGLDAAPAEAGNLAERLGRLLASLPEDPAVRIEDKTLTATLHVRPRDDATLHAAVGERIRPRVEAAGLALRPGKASWEIRPIGADDKGCALRGLIERLEVDATRTLYVGDDTTDEDAFRAIPEGITARVGAADADTAAGHHLPSPDAVYVFLERLVSR